MITLFLGEQYPVYAVFLYAKNERENLSPEQTEGACSVWLWRSRRARAS